MATVPNYADLEIRILDRQEEGYPVEITLNNEQEFPRGYLTPATLPWRSGMSPAEDGRRLFDWLCADDRIRAAWTEARGQQPLRRIRLRIDATAPELHTIPWETLRDVTDGSAPQDLAAATATPFSRYLAGRWQPGNPILKRPIRVLVAVANPANLADYSLAAVDVEQEWASLQEATAGLDVELVQLPQPCTLAALDAELRQGYHVLHLIGHGSYREDAGKAVLFMADRENRVDLVSDAGLAAMLARQLADADMQWEDKLRLVFLASCRTATRSPADAFRGFAPELVRAGVPAVVAMQDLVPVETARAFAATFYHQLLRHGLVDLAGNEARAALLTAALPGAAIPVLFMRLRSGVLLGRRGHITGDQEGLFWPFLLENIERGQCLPFLGPRVNLDLLPDKRTMAEKLAEKYGYPLLDADNLVRVCQFIAISDPDLLRSDYLRLMQRSLFTYLGLKPTQEEKRRFRNAGFTETVEALNWADRVLTIQEDEIHHLLADLDLPLYMTTNFDNFMVESLKQRGLTPRREGPRWTPQAGTPQYILTPPPGPDRPVVFHLNGYDDDPEQSQHLVLSEDDYLSHLVRLCRDQESTLPMDVIQALSRYSFLFLGYNIDDWEFRVILQGLLAPIAHADSSRKMHVGVQLEVEENPNAEQVVEYLRRYLGRFNIEIYWGTPRQFVTELHARWHEYLEMDEDEW